jgi:hypothetical protein
MDIAYIDDTAGVAVCVWDAPDRPSLEAVFAKAGVRSETIRQVTVYSG